MSAPAVTVEADDPQWARRAADGLGVYVHIPFCEHRCGYCDFAAFEGLDSLVPAYVDRLIREMRDRLSGPADTVFVGGGTPSRLPPDLLERVIAAVPKRDGAECSIEMNPESATPDVLAAARRSGANRISMGMQSVHPHVLERLERRHDPGSVVAAVRAARAAGFGAVSVDLIYGTPGESDSDWRASLQAALDLEVDHISAYALTVEAGTPLGAAVAAGKLLAPDEDLLGDRLELTAELLGQAGFARYEISNWSAPGCPPCLHNLRYWSGGAYVGVGCGAHSYDPAARRRSWNHRHPRTYVDAPDPETGVEVLDDETVRVEALMLGLRRACGIELTELAALARASAVDALCDGGLVSCVGGRARLTRRGMSLANAVVAELAGSLPATSPTALSLSGGEC